MFADLQFDKNTVSYRLPINVCEFIFNDAFPTEDGEDMVFRSLSEETLGSPLKGKLFQDFVTGFIRTRMPTWKVPRPPRYERDHLTPSNGSSLDCLENLELDVLCKSPQGITHVIECKFYNSPFASKFGGIAKVPNSHLLQLEAYVDLIIADPKHGGSSSKNVCGLLLYVMPEGASINADFSSKRYSPNVPIKIRCIDLTRDWYEIEADLVSILNGASI
jgi:5-methylcytosine-specific restriction endonuclease McrBC regulatory subunit McrC